MITVGNIYDEIDRIAPFAIQESYDNSGLIIGNKKYGVVKALIALDVTNDVAYEAEKKGVDLIITHHPVIFNAIKKIDMNSVVGILASNGISVISAHTNFDSAKGGMNDILCEKLGFIPTESICEENGVPIGYICELQGECSAKNLAVHVKKALGNKTIRYNDMNKDISKVAVCSGSGGSFLGDVIAKNADAYITGDVKHDVFIDAYNAGICVLDAGHFNTENIFCEYMKNHLSSVFAGLDIKVAQTNRDILTYEI